MDNPLVTINLVVYNGEKYLRYCLDAVLKQTYPNLQVNVFDNSSTDQTREIIEQNYPQVTLIKNSGNIGMWWGQEEALKHSQGDYILALSVDIILHPEFIAHAVTATEADSTIGAIQGKVYQYEFPQLAAHTYNQSTIIDTCGFVIYRSRQIGNLGHGEPDNNRFTTEQEIFAVEGAVPFFRRSALEASRLQGNIVDHDYRVGSYGHGDDLDLAWRMHLYGFKQLLLPSAIAYHDRKTTKAQGGGILGRIRRNKERRTIPLAVRRLDWSNVRFTVVKNDDIINLCRDLPYILWHELMVLGYAILFEPGILMELPRFLRLLPNMLTKRRVVQQKRQLTSHQMRRWFI